MINLQSISNWLFKKFADPQISFKIWQSKTQKVVHPNINYNEIEEEKRDREKLFFDKMYLSQYKSLNQLILKENQMNKQFQKNTLKEIQKNKQFQKNNQQQKIKQKPIKKTSLHTNLYPNPSILQTIHQKIEQSRCIIQQDKLNIFKQKLPQVIIPYNQLNKQENMISQQIKHTFQKSVIITNKNQIIQNLIRFSNKIKQIQIQQKFECIKDLQTHQKSIRAIINSILKINDIIKLLSPKKRLDFAKNLFQQLKYIISTSQKQKIDIMPQQIEKQVFKNTILLYILIINSLKKYQEIYLVILAIVLKQLKFIYNRELTIKKPQDLDMIQKGMWFQSKSAINLCGQIYPVRIDQLSFLLFGILLLNPYQVLAYISKKQLGHIIKQLQYFKLEFQDKYFWIIMQKIFKNKVNFMYPIIFYNISLCIYLKNIQQLGNGKTKFQDNGKYCKLIKKMHRILKQNQHEIMKNKQLQIFESDQYCDEYEDGYLIEQISCKKMYKVTVSRLELIQQKGRIQLQNQANPFYYYRY